MKSGSKCILFAFTFNKTRQAIMLSKCGRGQIRRKAYTYTRNGKKVHVSATCIEDRGKKGRGKDKLPTPEKGKLGKFGYRDVKSLSVEERHAALRRAVRAYGRNS